MKYIKRFNILISLFIGLTLGYFIFSEEQEVIDQLEYYEDNYKTKMGNTMMLNSETDWISYELKTLDGGLNWYAVKTDMNDGSVKILGEADSIYPGLVNHLEGMERLKKYVEENGSIDLSKSDSLEQLKLLENIGLNIKNGESGTIK